MMQPPHQLQKNEEAGEPTVDVGAMTLAVDEISAVAAVVNGELSSVSAIASAEDELESMTNNDAEASETDNITTKMKDRDMVHSTVADDATNGAPDKNNGHYQQNQNRYGVDKMTQSRRRQPSWLMSTIATLHTKSPLVQCLMSRRIIMISVLFTSFVLYRLHQVDQVSFLRNQLIQEEKYHMRRKYKTGLEIGNNEIIVPIVEREWDRMLFGIFTYDSPNEAKLRAVNRETHLSYFKHHVDILGGNRSDVICSLHQLLNNSTLAQDSESCRIVYSFVMGGGIGHANMTMKQGDLRRNGGENQTFGVKTRCLWEDPECGGKNIDRWTLSSPKFDVSSTLAQELKDYNDITLLSIPENHELGKTDTWFTYMAMLTSQYPELQIGFVGKIDSDNFIRWPVFFQWLSSYAKDPIVSNVGIAMNTTPFIYAGYAISKRICAKPQYNWVGLRPEFIAEWFVAGAHVYLSTPLVQHVYMHGTTLQRKKEVWILGEDLQLANMAYSDPKIIPNILNHRYGQYGAYINTHCFNDPVLFRKEYYKSYPEQEKRVTDGLISNSMNGTEGARASKGYIKWAKQQHAEQAGVV